MKAIHFGAGNIGRGFIGDLLSRNNYEICFVDVNQNLIDSLNKNKKYKVQLMDDKKTSFEIDNITALNSIANEEAIIDKIINADIITTSVGVANLDKISSLLAKGLLRRAQQKKYIDVIANENAINATNLMKIEIQKKVPEKDMKLINNYTGFVNSAIDRQALSKEEDGVMIPIVEPYFEWVINESEIKNTSLPKLNEVTYVKNLQPYIERKLYLVNAGHAVSAYLGQFLGKQTVQEALADQRVRTFVENLMNENAKYLINEYGMKPKELECFIKKTIERHSNQNIQDDVKRVGRSPIRKLGSAERIIAPLQKLYNQNMPTVFGERVVALVLRYNNLMDPEAVELEKNIKTNGVQETLRKYSELKDLELLERIEILTKEIEFNEATIFKG